MGHLPSDVDRAGMMATAINHVECVWFVKKERRRDKSFRRSVSLFKIGASSAANNWLLSQVKTSHRIVRPICSQLL